MFVKAVHLIAGKRDINYFVTNVWKDLKLVYTFYIFYLLNYFIFKCIYLYTAHLAVYYLIPIAFTIV